MSDSCNNNSDVSIVCDDNFASYRLARPAEIRRQSLFENVLAGTTIRDTVEIGKNERHYFVHVPVNYDRSLPTAVVMVFNGYGDERSQGDTAAGGDGMEEITGFSQLADKKNFLVIYMDGNPLKKHSWNNGQWWFSKDDDIAFTNTVLARVSSTFNVDQDRLYLSGFSQGGSFVHRLASDMPGRFAAIATVSSWMTGEEHPSEVSSLHMHSSDDHTVPMDGRKWWLTMLPTDYLKNFYRRADGITTEPQVSQYQTPNGPVRVESSANPNSGAEATYITVSNQGHHWFGGKGAEASPINATSVIWDFFERHTAAENARH